MDPLRIVFLDSWHPSAHEGSGTAVGISTLGRGLRDLGHHVEVLRPQAGPPTLRSRAAFNLRLPSLLRGRPSDDLVVGFDLDGWRWSASRPAASRYLVSLKGVAADEARFSRSGAERLLLSTLAAFERRNAESADRVLVPSDYSARFIEGRYGIPRERIRIVPEPIEMTAWDELRGSAPLPPRRPTILSVARQYPRKDTATLLRAFPMVRRAVPAVHLRVIGGGPELPRLRAVARELRIEDAVTFQGAIPEDEAVHRSYFEAHVFCLPSKQEGFGIAFLEAMAAGLPIVASRAGAVPEVVPDGGAGLLVPEGEPGPLAEALIFLLRDGAARERMGAAGIRRAREFDLPKVATNFLEATLPATVGHAR